jgi:hypothetical protein
MHKMDWPNNKQDTNSPVFMHLLQKYTKLMHNGEVMPVCPSDHMIHLKIYSLDFLEIWY